MLSQAELKEQLNYNPETGVFTRLKTRRTDKIGTVAGGGHNAGYIAISVKSRPYLAHRLAWLYVHGFMPREIDHINGVKTDNRIANLRPVTRSQNNANAGASKRSRSGSRGVFKHPNGKFRVQIKRGGKVLSLGYFETIDAASEAYRAASIEIYGDVRKTA